MRKLDANQIEELLDPSYLRPHYIAGVCPDDRELKTLYLVSAHLVNSTMMRQYEDGHTVFYETDLHKRLIAPEKFTSQQTCFDYMCDTYEKLWSGSYELTVHYWVKKYPQFEEYKAFKYVFQPSMPNFVSLSFGLQSRGRITI
jgi:hypothetical protein